MHFVYRIRYFLFLVALVTLLYGILRPESPPYLFTHSDKFLHFIAFFGFSLVTRFAFCKKKGVWLVWPTLFLSAPGLEYLQHYLQVSRQFSYGDMLGNLSGVITAFILWELILKNYLNRCINRIAK